jgi:two-component system, OmpR family, response regulator QseB
VKEQDLVWRCFARLCFGDSLGFESDRNLKNLVLCDEGGLKQAVLLIVEDDPMLGAALLSGLSRYFSAILVTSLNDARHRLETADLALIVLDLSLPDGSGLDLLREIRSARLALPVIILTARDGAQHRIEGLQLGADDYVGKPFDLGELVARCQAVMRRVKGDLVPVVTIGALQFNPAKRTVTIGGKSIALSATELRLFEVLIAARGRMLSKSAIEERLYDWEGGIESNTIEVYVSRLRRKLGKHVIQTARGLGYMIRFEP